MSVNLTHPRLAEYNGLWYLLGYSGGMQYMMKSADCGESWLRFANGNTQAAIGASDDDAGSIIKMHSQGARLVVAVPKDPDIYIYVSSDDGETWALESTVEMN